MNTGEENERYKEMKKNILDNIEYAIKHDEPDNACRWIDTLNEVECKIENL